MYNIPNYTYFQSPQSNETSQTYYLERTQSARITLEKALKIFPSVNSNSSNPKNKNENADANEIESHNDEVNLFFKRINLSIKK
jgi:hypothetical protein